MSKNNISKLFYKDYYKGVNFDYILGNAEDAGKENAAIIQKKNNEIKNSSLVKIARPANYTHVIKARIAYPGLVTGTGLVHDSKKLTGGYNLGMHFDYTTGMPIVYGSSVKGVLREYFKEFYTGADADQLEKEIFAGELPDGNKQPLCKRDIIFDAVIVEAYEGRIVEDDAITPHKEGPLKNPIPITMLKIAPGCVIEFRFRLHDSDNKSMSAEAKRDLFETILMTVGVGAKTNVGYGQLEIIEKK